MPDESPFTTTLRRVDQLLAGDGVVASRGRHGTVVPEADPVPRRMQRAELSGAAETLAVTARQLVPSQEETLAVRTAWSRFAPAS